jgi:hypothetical protein
MSPLLTNFLSFLCEDKAYPLLLLGGEPTTRRYAEVSPLYSGMKSVPNSILSLVGLALHP